MAIVLFWAAPSIGQDSGALVQVRNDLANIQVQVVNNTLPKGAIIMFDGQADIPKGWAICDGQNGTPNLVDRFVMGSTKEKANTKGSGTKHRHYIDPKPVAAQTSKEAHKHRLPKHWYHRTVKGRKRGPSCHRHA